MRRHRNSKPGYLGSALLLTLICGCASYNISSSFAPVDAQELARWSYKDLTLAVERPADTSQSYELGRFVEDLRKAGVFKNVEYADRAARADLVLGGFSYRETSAYQACPLGFAGEILTIATAGIIPQMCSADSEISFYLGSPTHAERRKAISFTYRTRTIMGWLALFYNPSSSWSAMPAKNERSHLLAAVFVHEATAIRSILEGS